jgi:hypothetical protein
MVQQGICYIHIGTHKTGTTSIQATLGINDVALLAHDVYIPRTGRLHVSYGGHHNIAWELLGSTSFERAFGTLAGLVDELRARPHSTACISAEDFEALGSRPEQIQTLASAIRSAGYEPRIIVYLRPQYQYVRSIYAELSKVITVKPFDQYIDDIVRTGSYDYAPRLEFDYEHLLAPFESVFGTQHIIVRPYIASDDSNRLLQDFVELIMPATAGAPFDLEVPRRLNVSPASAPQVRLDDVTLARLEGRFGPGNAAVARRFGVHIPVTEPIP